MNRQVKIACVQFKNSSAKNIEEMKKNNIETAVRMISEAAKNGANVVLVHELFLTDYFCQIENKEMFSLAIEFDNKNSLFIQMSQLAKNLKIVLPVSFFEKRNNVYYNSVTVFDADGSNLGIYRKSHIPTGPGYQEKFYFSPGDTGLKVFETKYLKLGLAICWDQWFPEVARVLALKGAELIMYPTAIGNEPNDPTIDSLDHWRNTMRGHAAANMVPVAVSNRIDTEGTITFFGNSFICDIYGNELDNAGTSKNAIIYSSFDFEQIQKSRASWGLFRDRRPDLYRSLVTLSGGEKSEKKRKLRAVPEYEHHSSCFICWPYRSTNWKNNCVDAQITFKNLVDKITTEGDENVFVFTINSMFEEVKEKFKDNCRVTVVAAEYDDSWARDISPTFVSLLDENEKESYRAMLFDFYGYGRKFPCALDRTFKKEICEKLRFKTITSPLMIEGGAIETNGDQILIATKPSVLKRNETLERFQVEHYLSKALGIRYFIWLDSGLFEDWDTDGHVDNICRFVSKDTVALFMPTDEDDPNFKICTNAREKIMRKSKKHGLNLKVVEITSPSCKRYYDEEDINSLDLREGNPYNRKVGDPICLSYINFYIANKAVFIPKFGLLSDDIACNQIKSLFPNRDVVQIEANNILLGGGGIHCILHENPVNLN